MSEELMKLVKDYFEAWDTLDVENVMKFFADKHRYECMAMHTVTETKEQLREFWTMWYGACDDHRVEVVNSFTSGTPAYGKACAEIHLYLTYGKALPFPHIPIPKEPISIMIEGVCVMEWKDGQIIKENDYWDALQQMSAFNALPEMTLSWNVE